MGDLLAFLNKLLLLSLHILQKATERVLTELIVFGLAVPDVQGGLEYWMADSRANPPWVLELSQTRERQGVNVLSVLHIGRVHDDATQGWRYVLGE